MHANRVFRVCGTGIYFRFPVCCILRCAFDGNLVATDPDRYRNMVRFGNHHIDSYDSNLVCLLSHLRNAAVYGWFAFRRAFRKQITDVVAEPRHENCDITNR